VLSANGDLLGSARRMLLTRIPGPGRAEQDPRNWLDSALAAGAEAVVQAGSAVDAVGVGALGPAPLLVDENLQPLTPALLFSLDRRGEAERAALASEVTHDHALPKLAWWSAHEPGIAARAAWVLDATGYLVSALTGVPTMDSITVLEYQLTGQVTPFPMPEPIDPLAIAGTLGAGPARALGVPSGLPVTAGTYDTYVDVAGAGVRRAGEACVLLGSTLVVCRAVSGQVAAPGLELSRYPGEGLLLGGWTATGGAALDWFRRELGAVDEGVLAAMEPGAGGILALPYLAGERTPIRDPDARGVVLGLTLRTTLTDVCRAFVDSVALSARDHLERLEAHGQVPDRWLAAGGGTRNRAWARATADALGAPLDVTEHAGEAAAPARLALRALGHDSRPAIVETIEPDGRRHERFERLYPLYRRLHPVLAEIMHELGRLEGTG
jgi:xylulokinase